MTVITPDPPYEKPIPHPNSRFMALTSNCNDMPTLFVDTHAPLDV
ncbi:GTP-dependent phosphoenolpyruvate carboxykinase [Pseudomonas sp. F-14 TE3623]